MSVADSSWQQNRQGRGGGGKEGRGRDVCVWGVILPVLLQAPSGACARFALWTSGRISSPRSSVRAGWAPRPPRAAGPAAPGAGGSVDIKQVTVRSPS